ncbi:10841_t:CDS:2 [Entrophospora sp. SA101]|nr:13420_t:CDS:2 [Entrophospora sp. SA101]CAJ0835367.1 10841_t:CDS:2 [Entrophospora sp. SA101]
MSSKPLVRKSSNNPSSYSSINSNKNHEIHSNGNNKSKESSQKSIAIFVMQGFFISIIMFFLASYFITETWTWGYQNQYTNWRNYIPRRDLILTEEELAKYDGSDPNLPIYIAINGEVFDVTAGKMYYGKDGGYKFFSGKDAARAYITGCFETHLTHDLRGLTSKQIKELDNWADFYRNHHTYYKVGRVIHPPIDPKTPIPEPCK